MFNENFSLIDNNELNSKLSDGASYELLESRTVKQAIKIQLYSSMGKTEYMCIKKECCWYLRKTAYFYNEPYNSLDAEKQISYFMYNNNCYKLINNEFIKDVDISSSPAVVDFRNAKSIIEKIEKEIVFQK